MRQVMSQCWQTEPSARPSMATLHNRLARTLSRGDLLTPRQTAEPLDDDDDDDGDDDATHNDIDRGSDISASVGEASSESQNTYSRPGVVDDGTNASLASTSQYDKPSTAMLLDSARLKKQPAVEKSVEAAETTESSHETTSDADQSTTKSDASHSRSAE